MTAQARRGEFEGVAKIIRFNTRFYLESILGVILVALLLTLIALPFWLKAAALFGTVLMMFWTVSSLLVSWYVYDHSRVMEWEWMRSSLRHVPSRWVNIHAGLDESTVSLRRLLPGTNGFVVDIYDPLTMTEPSIARARRMYPATEPSAVGSAKALPLPDADCDAVFLLFAAHELRDPKGRTELLREAHRILNHDGRVVLVEHLRDLPNFVAFGPGYLHFHTGRNWLRSINAAGFKVDAERRMTPFVRFLTLRKADA